MGENLLIRQGTIHNAVREEAFVADILVEDGKIRRIAPVLEGELPEGTKAMTPPGCLSTPGLT